MGLSTDDFTKDELDLIPAPDPEEQRAAEAADGSPELPADTTAATPAPSPAPTAAPTPAPTAAPVASPAPTAAPKQGNLSAALRAARHGEKIEREARLAAEAQLAEVLAKLPPDQKAAANADLTDEEMARLEADYPEVAKVARMAKQLAAAVPAATPAPTAAPAFRPLRLPDQLQEVVDELPDLLGWQVNPDQSLFQRAQAMDKYLSGLDAWQGKPVAERLAEVVKRVKEDAGLASSTTTRADPAAVIDSLPRATPSTLSDIGGGGGKEPPGPSRVERYSKMSDDDIIADLARG